MEFDHPHGTDYKMKLLAFTIFLGVTLAFPKYNQKSDQLGFSTLNGGTTGGKGGVVKYATSSESLIKAVEVRRG